jgi:hypothetical protein
MLQSREIFPTSLEHALLANRIMSVLKEVARGKDVPGKTEALEDALKFLRFIEKGRKSTEAREVSEDSYQAALAYGEAIKALEILPERTDVGKFLGYLIDVLTKLHDNKAVEQPAFESVSMFFRGVRDITLGRGRRRIEVLKFAE